MAHKIQMYENLRDMLEREVGEIERKRDLDKESLDNLFKLTASLKVVDKCIDREEMEEMKKNGMTNNMQKNGMSMGMSNGMSNDYSNANNSYGYSYNSGNSNTMPYMPMSNMGNSNMGNSNMGNSNMTPNWNYSMANGNSNAQGNSYNSYDSYDMGNSNRNYSNANSNDGRRGRDGDSDGRYSEDRGGNFRSNNSNRGYSRDGQYSRDASKKKMIQKLETMMDDTMSEKEREALQDCITKIDK